MTTDLLGSLVIVGLAALVMSAMLAPFETLTWWAGWSPAAVEQDADSAAPGRPLATTGPAPDPIVVYLSGIGSISGEELLAYEIPLLDGIAAGLPGGTLVRDVFPYSVDNTGLTGSTRLMHTLWRRLDGMRLRGNWVLAMLINLRNTFQVAVSADRRYGPLFDYGTARVIARAARQAGYMTNGSQRIVLIGYSGGGQVAVGTAPYLRALTGSTIDVISLGGVMSSDPGLRAIHRLTHLVGDQDGVERIGRIVFPGRWPVAWKSVWNLARASGVVTIVRMPGMTHVGAGSYVDAQARLPSGESYLDFTIRTIVGAIRADHPALVES